jgi:DNA-binding MarR family transcriptional regulator
MPSRRAPRSPKPTSIAAPPEALLGYRLWQVHARWHRQLERRLAEIGLTHLQYILLAATNRLLADAETPSQIRLATFTKIEKMMVSKTIRALERRGFLARKRNAANRRANQIELTAAGTQVLRLAFAAGVKAHEAFFRSLGRDWRTLDAMLDRLIADKAD